MKIIVPLATLLVMAPLIHAVPVDGAKHASKLVLEAATAEGCTDFVKATTDAGLKETADSVDAGGAPFTVFAFKNGSPLPVDKKDIKRLVSFHVVPGQANTALAASSLDTANSHAGKLTVVTADTVKGDGAASTISAGFKCKNGVLYVIDKPMTPSKGS